MSHLRKLGQLTLYHSHNNTPSHAPVLIRERGGTYASGATSYSICRSFNLTFPLIFASWFFPLNHRNWSFLGGRFLFPLTPALMPPTELQINEARCRVVRV